MARLTGSATYWGLGGDFGFWGDCFSGDLGPDLDRRLTTDFGLTADWEACGVFLAGDGDLIWTGVLRGLGDLDGTLRGEDLSMETWLLSGERGELLLNDF